jgi:predicted RNase H-like HicB family nuclease
MRLSIETEREEDGRWIAEIPELPGVMAYAEDEKAVVDAVVRLALEVVAEKLECGELQAEREGWNLPVAAVV